MTDLAPDWRYAAVPKQHGRVRVRQYCPNFVTGFETATVSVERAADLLEVPFIKQALAYYPGSHLRCEAYCHDYYRSPKELKNPYEYVLTTHNPDGTQVGFVVGFAEEYVPV